VRLGAVAESPLEWLALRSGRIPTPLVDTHLAFAWARTVMVATRLGVFEALADAATDAPTVASRCGSAPEPTRRLLDALTGMGYLRPAGADSYALPRSTRRWLTRASPDEVVDKVLFAFDEWRFVEHYERFVRTGESLDMHASFAGSGSGEVAPVGPAAGTAEDAANGAWGRYQRGLYALSKISAAEVARRTPVPRGATRLLDVGGAHGRFAVALAERHPGLTATILDLPDALATWESSRAPGAAGARVHTQAGDVFATDLGEAAWDVVFLSQLSHHFDDDANRRLAAAVARALRPGGVYVIQDLVRPASPREARRARLGALLDLYFAATSGAGTATLGAMRAWQSAAGLTPRPPTWMRTLPGMVQQVGLKPR
jgi:SAM-dependent methyltransferase